MRWFERRRVGLTARQLAPLVREILAAAYEGQDVHDPKVRANLIQDTADAKSIDWPADVPKLDIERLIEIIEQLMPLILLIISLF